MIIYSRHGSLLFFAEISTEMWQLIVYLTKSSPVLILYPANKKNTFFFFMTCMSRNFDIYLLSLLSLHGITSQDTGATVFTVDTAAVMWWLTGPESTSDVLCEIFPATFSLNSVVEDVLWRLQESTKKGVVPSDLKLLSESGPSIITYIKRENTDVTQMISCSPLAIWISIIIWAHIFFPLTCSTKVKDNLQILPTNELGKTSVHIY